jgi:hypothetical protein
VVTAKVKAVPDVSVTLAALENVGTFPTVKVKDWLAVPVEFLAVKVRRYTPLAVAPGVPASVAVPLPLLVKVKPEGNVPVWDSVGVGEPVVVTVKLNAWPPVATAEAALVIASPLLTVKVKLWVALGLTPLAAVIVRG